MSRIGRKPILIPKDVKVEQKDGVVVIQSAKGKLERKLHPRVSLEIKDGQMVVKRATDIASDRALHGLTRALLVNMIKGVTEGYEKQLEIIGVGFKATMKGTDLTLAVGFSHPVVFPSPEGITITTPKNTLVVIRGMDKEKVGEIAAEIRSVYPPEPYKGKGIRYSGEYVKKKVGKAQATAGGK
jgi:large subunit ribosomal protein L6